MTVTLTGEMLIGASCVLGTDAGQRAFNPTTNAEIAVALGDALLERAHAETGLPLARLTDGAPARA